MRSVLRAFAVVAALAFIAGFVRSAYAEAEPPVSERQIRLWSDWWVNEVGRQTLPVPQLLYIDSRFPEAEEDLIKLEPTDGPLKVIATFKAVDDHISESVWDLGLLTTEAFIPPPNNQPIYAVARREPSWARLRLGPWPWCGLAEFSGLKQIQKSRETFPWRKTIRSLATIGSTTFSEAQFEEDNPFLLNIPKRLSVYGDDLRLFEFSLPHVSDPAFWYTGGAASSMLFYRWSPPELDEMFSTPLPPSQ